ncbi:MAG: sigma-54-dependent Fis family transcriptional regulator [Deltaproteobacteria bacterium]|nr:sigma-54-dependent Fis family transcriptional regulator [Deltaproteobacteria bacterium]
MDEPTTPRALIVDDEMHICKSCGKILAREGFAVRSALSGRAAIRLLEQEPFDVVFTDLKMAEMGGMELLEILRQRFPDVVAVVITGYATIASVVETMKLGAFDYLAKPFTHGEMAAAARKAWEKRKRVLQGVAVARGEPPKSVEGIVGESPAMQTVYGLIRKVAPTQSTVLIIGETGTGKDLVTKAIHALSLRAGRRFFAVDCGTLSVSLLESELFGHMKGSFTGAVATTTGIFEAADGGTVFLDEICNVGLDVQSKLLRLIQEREFLPVGGTQTKSVDVRLVFATNRDIEKMVAAGQFREDLYYRLCVFPIRLPPLRERRADIPLLASSLLAKVRARSGKAVSSVSDAATSLLEQHSWPGNVRELESVIERAVISCDGAVIEPHHLPRILGRNWFPEGVVVPKTNAEFVMLKKRVREQTVAEVEREFVLQALERCGWNVTKAAAEVGLQRQNLQALMRKHGIRQPKEH